MSDNVMLPAQSSDLALVFFFHERFIKSQNFIHQLQTGADLLCLFDRKFQPYPKRMGLPKFVKRLESSKMAQRPVIILKSSVLKIHPDYKRGF